MTRHIRNFVAQLLQKYETASGKPCSVIACEMEIPISNYYLYRDGRGNPTSKTIDKILEVICVDYPEIIAEILSIKLQQLERLYKKPEHYTSAG